VKRLSLQCYSMSLRLATWPASLAIFVICWSVGPVSSAWALQTANASPTSSAAGASSASDAMPLHHPVEVDRLIFSGVAYCGSAPVKESDPANVCRLGDTLFVGFTNLREWMAIDTNHVADVALVIDGRVMRGLPSRGPDYSYSGLQFDLKRLDGDSTIDRDNRDAWSALVGQLRTDPNLHISVAAGGNPPYWGGADVKVKIFPAYKWIVLAFLVLLLVLFLMLGRRSDILRDSPSVAGEPRSSYSLARCQMAWWFFLIASSYNYIWLALSNRDSLTTGCLVLTGISAGTGLAAAVIDSGKLQQRRSLEKEQTLLTTRLAEVPQAIAATCDVSEITNLKTEQAQKTARLGEVHSALQGLPSPPGPSQGFLFDILRDETGISFHRFQMVAWTIILGFVFITSVYANLVMPDFSPTLLGLMGISSGTYIGFKLSDPVK
jgi:hypothetical protein